MMTPINATIKVATKSVFFDERWKYFTNIGDP